VRVEYLEDAKGTPTGTCAVLISNKGRARSLVANLAAANEYDPNLHLYTPSIWPMVETAHYYYIAGFFFTVSPEAIQRVAKHAAEENKWFIQNLAAPFISQFFTKPLDEAAPYWDVLIGNEAESDAYAESHGLDQHKGDLHAVAKHIASLPKVNKKKDRIVVLTHGHNPTVVAYKGQTYEFPVDPIVKDDIVDTNGAGEFLERLWG
jgi:adenosine kinase